MLTLASAPECLRAQASRADSAAVLLEAATTFAQRDRADLATALHRLILERFPDTPAAALARAALASGPTDPASNGATELQVWSTLYGAWLGVAVPGAFGSEDSEAYGVGLLVGAPLGFVVSRAVVRATDPTIGQARAVTLGGSWGTWQGFGWREVLDLGAEDVVCDLDFCVGGDTGQETFAAMLLGGTAGIAVGALLGRASVSDAVATGANTGALWGSWFGTALGVLAGLDDDDLLAAALVGGDLGLAGAALATPSLGFTRNRWRIMSAAGLVGGVAGLGLDLLIQPDGDKVAVSIPLVTSLVGLALGAGVGASADDRKPRSGGDGGGAGRAATAGRAERAGQPGGLLELDRDGLALGFPSLMPRRLPVETADGTKWRPTLGVTWLRVHPRSP